MKLYKFVAKEHLQSFFKAGSLRLGTIYSFKDTVEYGQSRGDEGEGRHSVSRTVVGDALHLDKPEPIVSEIFGREVMPNVYVKDMQFSVERRSPDAFIFCTSNLFSNHLFKRWQEEEGTDACYEISDPVGFFDAISDRIAESAKYIGNGDVVYIDGKVDYRSSAAITSPALTKDRSRYGWQFENRAIWSPRGPCGRLKPWIINVPDAVSCCNEFAVFEDDGIRRVNDTNNS